MHHHTVDLVIIFSFVIVLCGLKQYFRWKRSQLWHETAQLALEKGQPLPTNSWECGSNRGGRRSARCDVRRGIVFIAVGAALYFALPAGNNAWAAIPGFIGIAFLIFGLFSFLQSDKSADPKDRDPSGQK
jgi:hypothetical protein